MVSKLKIEDIKKEFDAIEEEENANRERQVEDLRFGYSDDQWPEELRRLRENDLDGARPCLTVNKIAVHARQITNDMRQNRASVRILPVDDAADIETAKILQGMVRHIEHVSNAGMAYDIAAEFQVMCGIGYIRVDLEVVDPIYNHQEIMIKPVRNPFSVYFDPWVTDNAGSDARRVFQIDHMSEQQFMREFPDANLSSFQSGGSGDAWIDKDRIRVAEHWWIDDKDCTYLFVQPRMTQIGQVPPPPEAVRAEDIEGMEDQLIILGERTVAEPEVRYQKLNGEEILEGGDSGLVLPGRYIPIVRVPGEDVMIEDERYTTGIVRRARDAQRAYNYAMSTNIETMAMQPKNPWLVGRNAIDGYEDMYASANQKNYAYLPYNETDEQGNPTGAPTRQPPAQPNTAAMSLMETSNGDLQATIGQMGASLGEVTNERSGLAIHNRQKAGDMATYHFVDNMAQAVRHVGRIIVDLIPVVYDTERVARIMGEDGDAEQVTISPGAEQQTEGEGIERIYDVGVGKYDVAVSTGPSFNTKRQEAFESMSAIIDGNPQLWTVIGDLMVKNMDWPGADEMAERLHNIIPPEVRGEEDEMGALQQQLAESQQVAQEMEMQLNALMAEREQMMNKLASKEADKEINRDKLMAQMIDKDKERKIKLGALELDKEGLDAEKIDNALRHAIEIQKLETDAQLKSMSEEMAFLKDMIGKLTAQ